jgi:hypothetical protein
MGFAEVFGLIYSLLKAIPVLDKAVRAFFKYYAELEVAWFERELYDAIEKAIKTGQTSDLEHAIGSPRSGKLSGDADSEFIVIDKPK